MHKIFIEFTCRERTRVHDVSTERITTKRNIRFAVTAAFVAGKKKSSELSGNHDPGIISLG